jgi:glycosyltransferase involved in cell wall biosynthesis
MSGIFIIIPCYNEAQVIRSVLEPLLESDYEIVLVDDGSQDTLAEEVKGLPIHYLRHLVNLGQGAALQTGMRYAREQGAEMAVHFDADGQHKASDIERLIAPLKAGEADIVLGSRFLEKKHSRAVPPLRRLLLKVAILVNGIFSGIWLSDAHNGFRALNRKALESIELTENRVAHATEILIQMKKHKLRYQEIPTLIEYSGYAREKGQSSLNSINILIDLIFNRIL